MFQDVLASYTSQLQIQLLQLIYNNGCTTEWLFKQARREQRVFLEGDMVFLKLQTYVQSSVIHRAHNKLTFKFYGPYKILQKIGYAVCKLELWVFSRIHPMFQMSQLKQFMPPTVQLIRWLQGYLLLMLMWRFLLRFFAVVSGNGIIVPLLKSLSNGVKLTLKPQPRRILSLSDKSFCVLWLGTRWQEPDTS